MPNPDSVDTPAWDRAIRWFHWVNVLLMIGLLCLGTIILNGKLFGLSNDGKVFIKSLHAYIGYAFAANLVIRLVWAFIGSDSARWRSLLPSVRDLKTAFTDQLPNLFNERGHHYEAHSPLGKISIALMLGCMAAMATTGLVLAGTDLFLPPFGHWIAQSVAAPGIDPSSVVPYHPELLNEQAYEAMRAWRAPFQEVHEVCYYLLLGLIPLHIAGVVLAETRGANGMVSAMISGRRHNHSPAPGESRD